MNIFQSVGASLLGLPSTSQEAFSVNYLTLTFKGELAEYEKSYQDDYFLKSLESFQVLPYSFNDILWCICLS